MGGTLWLANQLIPSYKVKWTVFFFKAVYLATLMLTLSCSLDVLITVLMTDRERGDDKLWGTSPGCKRNSSQGRYKISQCFTLICLFLYWLHLRLCCYRTIKRFYVDLITKENPKFPKILSSYYFTLYYCVHFSEL